MKAMDGAFSGPLAELGRNLRHSIRLLRRRLGSTVVAVLTLALGIGANTAIFSLVYGVMLSPLPYPKAERLVRLETVYASGSRNTEVGAAIYSFWRQYQSSLEGIAAFGLTSGVNMAGGSQPERIAGLRVTADLFNILGVRALLGRTFLPGEDQAGAAPVALISHGLWQRRFGGDLTVLNRRVVLDDQSAIVVGVLPDGIDSTLAADVWTPLNAETDALGKGDNYGVLGRLRPGVTLEQAQADFRVLAGQFRAHDPKHFGPKNTFSAFSYRDELIRGARPALLALFGSAGLVLLMACANVANLLLARVAGRRHEIAVRLAMGATRARLLRQLITESLCLALLGGLVGVLLAQLAVPAIIRLDPMETPQIQQVAVNSRVLLFALSIAVLTGILFGLAPALEALGPDVRSGLQANENRAGGRRGGRSMRKALVVIQFALSVTLLIGAALLAQSFVNLRVINPGFDPERVLTLRIALTGEQYRTSASVKNFAERLVRGAETLPGVSQAALSNNLPLGAGMNIPLERIEGQQNPPGRRFFESIRWFAVTPHFPDALRIKITRGRGFNERDTAGSPPVAMINQTFVNKHFPNENPLGRRISVGWNFLGPEYGEQPREIVGIMRDIHDRRLQLPPRPSVFVPLTQVGDAVSKHVNAMVPLNLIVRTNVNPLSVSQALVKQVDLADPLLPVYAVKTMENVMDDTMSSQHFIVGLLGGFALMAITLACIGIYGVMSYVVTERTREIGVRVALGASPGALFRSVIGEGLLLAMAGLAAGSAGAWGLTRMLESLLFGVASRDARTFALSPLLLVLVAVAACYIPARRALKIEPMMALRHD